MNNFYVYQLIDPRNGNPFYIGKGVGGRMYSHEKSAKKGNVSNGNKYLFNKIKKILGLGYSIGYSKIIENISESDAFEWESALIKKYGIRPSGILCNLSYGGEGNSGYKWTPEQIEQNRIRALSYQNDPDYKRKYWEGRNSVDWKIVRERQAKTLKNKFLTDSKFLEEHRKRMRTVNSSPEAIAANAKRITKFYQEHPEQKEKLSVIQKQLWASGKYNNSKEWEFKSPSGEIVRFTNLAKFCRESGLSFANMAAVSSKRRNHHRGWTAV